MENKKININIEFLVVILLFAISVAIRFLIANRIRNIAIIPDEYRYYLLASSIYTGKGLSIHNFPTEYQKILYSVFLSPAFAFDNIFLRFSVIALINSLLISSGIFPYYLLIKKILKNKTNIIICTALYIFSSDLSYSHTLMSEVLFLPLCMWFIYLFYIIISKEENKKYYILPIILGLLLYALYLTKEIALVFLISYFLILLYKLLKKEINLKSEEIKKFIIFLATFAIIFIIFKLTLFAGFGNSYDQQSIDALFKHGSIEFLIYSFLWFIATFIISLFIFPIILPILNYNQLSKNEKKLYNYLIILLTISSLVIAYTISIREDFYFQTIRFHERYVNYLYIIFIIYFCKCLELKNNEIFKNKNAWIITFCLIVYSFLFLRYDSNNSIASIDNTIRWLKLLELNTNSIIPILLYLFLFTFSFIIIYLIEKKKLAFYSFITIYIFSACYSNVIFYQQGVKYTMKIFHIQNVDYIKKFIELNPDKYFIYNNEKECMGIKEDTYFDTFNSNFKNIIYRYSYKMLNSKKDFEKEIKNIDYIITLNIIEFEMPSLKDVDEIPIKNKLFKIFKVKNKNKFPIMSKYSRNISTSIIRKMHNTKYIIYSADDNCIKLPSQKYIKEPVIDLSKGKYEIEIKTANIESCKIQISTFNKIINHTMTGNKIFFSLESDTKSVVTSFRNISNSDIIINDITIKKIK